MGWPDGPDGEKHQPRAHSARGSRTSSRSRSGNGHSRSNSGDGDGLCTPPPFSSPSVASSFALSNHGLSFSPLRPELSRTTLHDEADQRASRYDLARRLSRLAHRLAYGDSDVVDELALSGQLDRLEKAIAGVDGPGPEPRRSVSFETRTRSDAGSIFGSPGSSLLRSRFSNLSASLHREREAEQEWNRREPLPKRGMTAEQTNKVVVEMGKLNDELSTVVSNLRARQEESDHIHALLVERAERAAQRIIFLQNRISYLEQELRDNDDELQHLRICLKAVEIQMPPHPDKELQRCIATFKQDYQALKKKRASRASIASVASVDSSTLASPTR